MELFNSKRRQKQSRVRLQTWPDHQRQRERIGVGLFHDWEPDFVSGPRDPRDRYEPSSFWNHSSGSWLARPPHFLMAFHALPTSSTALIAAPSPFLACLSFGYSWSWWVCKIRKMRSGFSFLQKPLGDNWNHLKCNGTWLSRGRVRNRANFAESISTSPLPGSCPAMTCKRELLSGNEYCVCLVPIVSDICLHVVSLNYSLVLL